MLSRLGEAIKNNAEELNDSTTVSNEDISDTDNDDDIEESEDVEDDSDE